MRVIRCLNSVLVLGLLLLLGAVGCSSGGSSISLAPTITSDPADQSVVVGSSAPFSVVATGSAPLSYQWQLNGSNVGTNSASYSSSASLAVDSYQVTVTVTNGAGKVTSHAATLAVTSAAQAPAISTQPASQRVMLGSGVTFTVVASGTAPLRYQWTLNGSPVGGNAPWLAVADAQTGAAGSYSVTVTNGTLPDAVSTPATLTVDPIGFVVLPGGTPLGLVPIPATTVPFLMGAPPDEPGYFSDETQHPVTISQAFYMGTYQVTQAQWQALMGNAPSRFSGVSTRPVEQVSWIDICHSTSNPGATAPDGTSFLEVLNAATVNTRPAGMVFRLPTEAEWEYACRAGTTTAFYWGADLSGNYAWYDTNSDNTTHPVGGLLPNAWGLYDMAGNVSEWCQDWFDPNYYSETPSGGWIDPVGPASSPDGARVFRGGAWDSGDGNCRSAFRYLDIPDFRDNNLGFRVVLAPPRAP